MHGDRDHRLASFALLVFASLLTAVFAVPVVLAQGREAGGERTGKMIYREACANCHGADGRGAPRSSSALTMRLPDFTDCNFVTRERGPDWHAIVHEGGPVRAFNRMMPAFGDALQRDEIDRVLAYVKSFCGEPNWPTGDLNFPRALVTEKAFPEDEAVLTSTAAVQQRAGVGNKLIYEKRLGARNQIEVIVPFSFHSRSTGERFGGIGDVAVGFKRVMYQDRGKGTIVSGAGELTLPTGQASRGFGNDVVFFEPVALLGQKLPFDTFLQAQAGAEISFDPSRSVGEAYARAAAGRSFTLGRFSRLWTPMIEIVAARKLSNRQPIVVDLLPEFQVTLSRRQHVRAGVGVLFPLKERASRGRALVVYLLWDWFDGPLFGGWQ